MSSALGSQLPNPAHLDADSMLARRFGKETVNYFGGELNPARTLGQARTEKRKKEGKPVDYGLSSQDPP